MKIKVASVDSLIIYFGDKIDKDIAKKVKNAYLCIKKLNLDGIIEIVPSYTSILITYDIFTYDYETIKTKLEDLINLDETQEDNSKLITIDVYYGTEVGLDLQSMSEKTGLSIEQIIKIHSEKTYDVYAIGFLPGFGYLASVDERIALPRLSTPRKSIPKGSVAIANTQTAVYPQASPGGWNIVGRTAFDFFDKNLDTLSPISVGDRVKFNPISKEQFLKQGGVL